MRVNDILAELEKQTGPLERQSEKAKIYLKKKEALKTLDVNVFLLENVRVRKQLEEVEGKLHIAGGDLDETTQRYESIKEEYEQIQGQIEMLEQAIEEARSTLTDTGMMRSKLEGEINVLKEQIHSAEGNEEHLQSRIRSIQSQIDEREKEKEGILLEKGEIDEKLATLEGART